MHGPICIVEQARLLVWLTIGTREGNRTAKRKYYTYHCPEEQNACRSWWGYLETNGSIDQALEGIRLLYMECRKESFLLIKYLLCSKLDYEELKYVSAHQ